MVFNKLFGKFKKAEVEDEEEIKVQDYLDMIAPSTIRFYTEYTRQEHSGSSFYSRMG